MPIELTTANLRELEVEWLPAGGDHRSLVILEPNVTGPGAGLRPVVSDWSGFTRILGL
jgi:hypothetical protein